MKKFPIHLSALLLSACAQPPDPPAEVARRLAPATRQPELLSVTRDYGELIVSAGRIEVESAVKPWSAWWLPLRSKYLFEGPGRGQPGPLVKLDLFSKRSGIASQAAAVERDKFYDPDAASWEGSCDAWAIASLMEAEPSRPVTRQGVTFGVGDQKALLVKTYEHSQGKVIYGKPFRGERGADFDDVYADQFHRFVMAELFERGRPFIMDKDPGIPVWNTPVYKVAFDIRGDETDEGQFHVAAIVWGADPAVESYDDVGTRTIVFRYFYDLYGNKSPDGTLQVSFGVWVEPDHPDFVVAVPERVTDRASRNPEIRPDLVDAIIRGE